MTPEDEKQLKAHLKAVVAILYKNTASSALKSFEGIKKSLREQILKEVEPKLASFFFKVSRIETGRKRKLKPIVGSITLIDKQTEYFGLKSSSQLSPMMEKNALLSQ